jgi:lauroyl/myristoyl acyltransferase
MEQLIALCPSQYFWSYNRYKRPQGVAAPEAETVRMRFLIALLWLLHWLPLPILGRIGAAVGSLMYYAIPKRRRIALTNLRLCMPELSEAERTAIVKRHFQGYSRSILERSLLWWAPIPRLRRLIHIEPSVPQAEMESGPTILLCPHFVCLDVAGVAARVIPVASIYSPQKNKAFDACCATAANALARCACSPARTASSRSCARCATACPTSCCRTWTSARRMRPSCPSSASRPPP